MAAFKQIISVFPPFETFFAGTKSALYLEKYQTISHLKYGFHIRQ